MCAINKVIASNKMANFINFVISGILTEKSYFGFKLSDIGNDLWMFLFSLGLSSMYFTSEDKMRSDFTFCEGKIMQKMEILSIFLISTFSLDCQESKNLHISENSISQWKFLS